MFLNYFVYIFRSIEVKLVLVTQVARVFYYLSAAALQYLAPTILLLFSVLMLRTLGRWLRQRGFGYGPKKSSNVVLAY